MVLCCPRDVTHARTSARPQRRRVSKVRPGAYYSAAERAARVANPELFARLDAMRSGHEQQMAKAKSEIDSLKDQLITTRTTHVEHVRQMREQFSSDFHALEQKFVCVQQELTTAQDPIKALQSTNEELVEKLATYAGVKQFIAQIAAATTASGGEANGPVRPG